MRLDLPPSPVATDDLVAEAARVFASLTRDVAPGSDPDRFLLETAPARLFQAVLDPDGLGIPPPGFAAAGWVAGAWRGHWLRRSFVEATPDGDLAGAEVPSDPTALDAAMVEARSALGAASGSDEAALAFVEASIEDWAGAFGTSLGALQEALAYPSLEAEPRDDACIEVSLLWADLDPTRLGVTPALREVAESLDGAVSESWSALSVHIADERAEAVDRARMLWASTFSPVALDAQCYARLIDALCVALEIDQAIALTGCLALGESDADAARRAATAASGSGPWHAAMGAALMDGSVLEAWPRFDPV